MYDSKKVKRVRLNLDKYQSCITSMEATMCDIYAFPKEANWSLTLVETGTAPIFLLFLWKQTPTLFTRQRKCLVMHELRG